MSRAMMSASVREFLRSRPIAMLSTRDAQNRPSLHECVFAAVEDDHVLGMVPEHLGRNLKENVADNGDAALVVSRSPGDHRSVQLKGKITSIEEARCCPERFEFPNQALLEIFGGYMPEPDARERVSGMRRQSVFLVRLDVAEEFDQSPGPGAGRRIEGDRS